ncbi:hypothetical protein VaNZ11_003751 [Volvox africanus]|uniref:indole-3-pyruvate monooxygenase n=1 Tax=Volvox africanus TaxID=51714 RepID=A0ABQ5RUS4_9CHLO|nr:hypothetical protein VaNZ11_003751 [Volvox africanus]
MPHAVVVGTDATALHIASQLSARGFEVTLLEASQAIGGQWVQRLFADSADCEFNAAEDGVFLDFPFRAYNSKEKSVNDFEVNDESIGNPAAPGRNIWAAQTKIPPNPVPSPPTDQQLLRHLAEYAQAAGLHRNVRLGCTLRRAKWQAMNGCWRLELKTESEVQRGAAQLSADLLVISRQAVAGTRLPRLPGGELYCGTIITANDQFYGPAGEAILEQQLRGRNVLVVGPPGPMATGWAEACRRHAGYGGSVVLLEVEVEEEDGEPLRTSSGTKRHGITGGGPLSRLFSSCFGLGSSCGRVGRSSGHGHGHGAHGGCDVPSMERFSPAQSPCSGPDLGSGNGSGGDGGLISPDRGSGTSGTLDDAEGLMDDKLKTRHTSKAQGEGATEPVELYPGLAAVCRLEESATGPSLTAGTDVDRGEPEADRKYPGPRERPSRATAVEDGGGGGRGSGGDGANLAGGRSALRVLRGVGALLNGTHVMLSTGEELPVEVLLLIPLGGVETSLAFLDAGGPLRLSQTGGSSVGGSFIRKATTSLAAASGSLAIMPETISRQLDVLYRDMLSNSPFAPNFALVGTSPRASQHDARMAAAQAAWLLATWVGLEDQAAAAVVSPEGPVCHTGHGSGAASAASNIGGNGGGGGLLDPSWWLGAHAGGFMRQASPVEAAADAALRARWRREAAKLGTPDLYQQCYLHQLLVDLGVAEQKPSRWRCSVGISRRRAAAPGSEQLTRQRVAKLLGLKRLRRVRQPVEDASSLGQSLRTSPGHNRGYSCSGGEVFTAAQAAAVAALVGSGGGGFEHGNVPATREVSRSSHQVGFPARCGNCSTQQLPLHDRSVGSRSLGGGLDASARFEGSFRAFRAFASQNEGTGAPGGVMTTQQMTEGCFSTGSLHSPHHQNHASINNGGNASNNNNNSLSFALGFNQMLSHELQLYRVAEHPAEHLGDPPAGPPVAAVGVLLHPPASPQPQSTHHYQHALPSCPSSPSLALATALCTSPGSISGSIGNLRGRFLGASFSMPTGGGGAGVLASAVTTSPCILPSCGGSGMEAAGAAVAAIGPMSICSAVGGEDTLLQGGSQQNLRSQLLQRHRSTSRLAGMSNAASVPSTSQQHVATSGALSQFFGRRAAAVSTSQVSFDIPKSFLTDCRPHSGRPSNPSNSSRRFNNMSAGGGTYGCCSTGSLGMVGRANSYVRLQLLLAAASSASRRRTAMAPTSPLSIKSSDNSCSTGVIGTLGGGGDSKLRLQTAYSEALGALPSAMDRSCYRCPYASVTGAAGGRPSGMGTSVAAVARAHCISNGPGNAHGSVSEPVAGELVSATDSLQSSPAHLHPRMAYGRISETISAQLPVEAAATVAAVVAAEEVAGAASDSGSGSDYITGEQQWSDGEPSFRMRDRGSQADDGASLGSGTPVKWRRARRRSITLPDLCFAT